MASSPSLSLVAVLAIAVLAGTAVDAKNLRNEFIVTYSIIPDPFHTFSFYSMPRNEIQARKMGFTEVQDNWDVDNTSLWCLKNDYRVCVLFDGWGTAAGIQVSASVEDIKNSKLPSVMETELLEDKHEYWIRQKLLGVDVLSTVVYFTSRQVLISGGRGFEYDGPTLFSGYLYIKGRSGILAVSSKEEEAEKSGFTKQGCFFGMGRHYFQELNSTTECENHKPYFMLYDPKEAKLNGFGITAFGKTSINNRSWFEKPPAAVIGMIAPNAPTCLKDWVSTYGLFTIHVYFVKRPWFTMC